MRTVYISGPISGTDDYMERFSKAESWLKLNKFRVLNPAKVNATLPDDTPWLTYMRVSLAMLQSADTIFMLRDWELSRGACMEIGFALASDKAIMYEQEDVTL